MDMIWMIAYCVLLFLTAFPALIIFFCSLCLVRTRKDPSRSWLSWFKVGFCLFAISKFMIFFVYGFAAAAFELYDLDHPIRNAAYLLPVQVELDLVGRLLADFSEFCTALALIGLDIGILIAHKTTPNQGSPGVSAGQVSFADRVFYLSIHGVAFVLSILAIAAFGLGQNLYAADALGESRINYDHSFVGRDYLDTSAGKASRHLSLAVLIIYMITIMAMTTKSIHTKRRVGKDRRVQMASTYLIVCNSLSLLRAVYNLIYCTSIAPRGRPESAVIMAEILLDTWPAFIVLCILFALGCKKRGLWSTMQPDTPSLLDQDTQQSMVTCSHIHTSSTESVMEPAVSPMHSPQLYEMPASSEVPRTRQFPQHQIPRRPITAPEAQELQIRDILAHEPDDDQPPDYYSAGHRLSRFGPGGFQPISIVQAQAHTPAQAQAGPSTFALPAQPEDDETTSPDSSSLHTDAMGLYHQADGTPPQSETLPYDEKKSV